jgi:CHASE2 domain-containing sensor protein
MSKRVGLRLDGTLESGFQVTLEVGEDQFLSFSDVTGTLPAAPELVIDLEDWQQQYRQLSGPTRIALQNISIRTNSTVQLQACHQLAEILQRDLNAWLESPTFQGVEKLLRESIDPTEPVRILLRTTDRRLHQLPWHCWEFIDRYPQAEVALSTLPARGVEPNHESRNVRILAILGDRRGIDIEHDRQLLETLPDATVEFLVEPSREHLNQCLWDQSWDILFFAGHSNTEGNREESQGRLHINPEDSLTIAELKYGLRQAISHGLQLAIFNSCDGLGLAYELESLHLPQLIVMREPVPDLVAQAFLKHFLVAFTQGKDLYPAVREARERLQGLEAQYPCATWLPIICQNPAIQPYRWQRWQDNGNDRAGEFEPDSGAPQRLPVSLPRSLRQVRRRRSHLLPIVLTSLMVTGVVLIGRFMGLIQPLEMAAFDQLVQMRPDERPDPRLLVILITEEDVQAQPKKERRGSLSDRTLIQLLKILEDSQAQSIGLDIYRDYPIDQSDPKLVKRLQERDRVVAICKAGDAEKNERGVAPPPEISPDQVAFSDVVIDPDTVIRRHLLAMTPSPSSRCVAPYALSTQLALRYLDSKGIPLQYPNPQTWQLGPLMFHPLTAHTGGYQRLDDRGHQILLNYRSLRSPEQGIAQVTLGQILAGQINPNAIKDRIVLIGTIAEGTHDYWITPYHTAGGYKQTIPGVLLQAQMTSQLLSAVLDGRPLIWSWSAGLEVLWVWVWVLLGGTIGVSIRNPISLGLAIAAAIGLLFSCCLLLLVLTGAWVPLVPAVVGLGASGLGLKILSMKGENHNNMNK